MGSIHPFDTSDGLMTPKEAAAFLRLSVLTLSDLRVKGGSPRYVKTGRLVRYRLKDLEAWIDSRTFGNTAEAKAEGVG